MKKSKFSKFLVVFIVFCNVIFTIAVLYIFLKTEEEPSVLITAWFAFTTGELWALAGIKKTEAKSNDGCTRKENSKRE